MPGPINEVKLRVNVEGAEGSAAGIQKVWAELKRLSVEAKAAATGPFKDVWDSFKQGQVAGGSLSGTFNALTTAARGPLGPVAALAVGVGAYVVAAKHAADKTVEMYQEFRSLAAVAGGTTKEVEGLVNAFKLMGLPTESIRIAMFRLGIAVENDSESLRSLGIATRDAEGMTKTPIAAFKEMADRLDAVTSAAQKSAIIREIMGRSGVQMAAFFKLTKEQREKYIEQGEEMGALDDELIDRTVKLMGKAGEAELAWKKFNAELARTAGIKMKETLYTIEAGVANLLMKVNALWAKWADWVKLFPLVRSGMALMGMAASAAGLTAPPMGATAEAAKKATAPSFVPLSKEEFKKAETRLKHEEEMRRIILKGTAEFEAEKLEVETGFAFKSKERKLQETRDLMAEENKAYAEHLALLRKRFPDDASMQKELEKLNFDHQKKMVEMANTAAKQEFEIQKSKAEKFISIQKDLVDKLKAFEAEKAGIGGSLEDKALASLRARGYKGPVSIEMIDAEVAMKRAWGAHYSKELSKPGGKISLEQWEFMKGWQPGQAELRDKFRGGTTGGALSMSQMERGLAYEGKLPPMAEMAEKVQREEFKILGDKFLTITEAIKGMRFVIDGHEFGNIVQDSLARSLEFQAARQ